MHTNQTDFPEGSRVGEILHGNTGSYFHSQRHQQKAAMACAVCASDNQAEFTAEMNIHSTGLKNLDEPSVWVFPELPICLDCGFLQFAVPAAELALLARAAPEGRVLARGM